MGCPSIDALISEKTLNNKMIMKKFNLDLKKPFLLVIQHPVTSELREAAFQMQETLKLLG